MFKDSKNDTAVSAVLYIISLILPKNTWPKCIIQLVSYIQYQYKRQEIRTQKNAKRGRRSAPLEGDDNTHITDSWAEELNI